MLEFIKQPWPWYVAGPLIGLIVPGLLLLGNKPFGISSTLKHICAACVPAKIPFFQYDWKKEAWNLYFVTGIFFGGIIASTILAGPEITIQPETIADLKNLGINTFEGFLPTEIFSLSTIFTPRGLLFIVIGGFLVGFGTRWGNGCTSGHAITGLSNLQWSSLVATISFMFGGWFTTNFLLPYFLQLP
ncbi:MAG: YeeE/YedE family protein [Cytophagales bacterium]|nr:YeeE/YedE family protein [Cytophagales bacterium]